MEHGGSLLCSKDPDAFPYINPAPAPPSFFFTIHFNVFLLMRIDLPSWNFVCFFLLANNYCVYKTT
jgi:hypothetical protein